MLRIFSYHLILCMNITCKPTTGFKFQKLSGGEIYEQKCLQRFREQKHLENRGQVLGSKGPHQSQKKQRITTKTHAKSRNNCNFTRFAELRIFRKSERISILLYTRFDTICVFLLVRRTAFTDALPVFSFSFRRYHNTNLKAYNPS